MEVIDVLLLLLAGVGSWIGAGLMVLIWHLYAILYFDGPDDFDRQLQWILLGEDIVAILLWPVVLFILVRDLLDLYSRGELHEYREPDLSEVG